VTVHDFHDLVLRWIHLIAGIMWVGNSMLFNWLDRNLVKPAAPGSKPLSQGEIWLLHSGAFYQVEKKLLAPHEMPAVVHWFKWQNGITWLSGISLLVVVYYLQGGAFLIDPQVAALDPTAAVALCVMIIVGAWIVYDVLWTALESRPRAAAAVSFALLAVLAWGLTQLLSGRAAFIHVGVVLGTLMTGNVWLHIVPSQHALIAATQAGKPQDPRPSLRAKQRSIHNNYMTFPLLFIMISNHFPATYGDPRAWIVLFVLMLAGAGIRHMMNVRFVYARWLPWALAIATVATALLFALTRRAPAAAAATGPANFSEVRGVVERRCRPCHSARPTDTTFPAPPLGVTFDSPEQIARMATRMGVRAVEQRSMPFLNRTGMTDAERDLLGRWIAAGAQVTE
jgi:uncharacterized membrane protein